MQHPIRGAVPFEPAAARTSPAAGPRYFRRSQDIPAETEAATGHVLDSLGRPLRDLRISVTDRCNFRCIYCMPKEIFGRDYAFLPRDALLSFEEITRIARIAAAHGVEKVRLTGGEPLLRKDLEVLISMLAELTTADGRPLDIALTTNGSVLARKAQALKDAGLQRVTVSLDSVDDATFRAMNDVDYPVAKVLDAIEVARQVGLGPVKVNMVVKRGQNDQDILLTARHFKDTAVILRFIEYMDVGASNGWNMADVIPSADIIARINAELPLAEIAPHYNGETSARWRYRDGGGEIGVISSVTQAFCSTCTRVRISSEGKLFTCLFADAGHDLRELMRNGCSDEQLSTVLAHLWRARSDRYSEQRSAQTNGLTPSRRRIEMSYIGG